MAGTTEILPLHNSKNITSNGISIWCYVLIIVGTASVILGVINLFVIKWCAHRRQRRSAGGEAAAGAATGRIENPACLASFKYRKGKCSAAEQECCVICLSAFHEVEEVRRLPNCNHLFHAPCIDMWLFSHSDCPLCRTPVKPALCHTAVNVTTSVSDNSREGLLDSRSLP